MTDLATAHRTLLERFRHAMNLVGPGPVDVHFDDCRAAVADLAPEGRWADLGSGAGFPGLVFAAVYPEVAVVLVDSRQKRCWFLRQVLAEADLAGRAPIAVVHDRIENIQGPYDGILARALAPPGQVLDHARRLLAPGGRVVLFLQEDAAPPEDPAFELLFERPYAVGERRRKVAVLTRRPGDRATPPPR